MARAELPWVLQALPPSPDPPLFYPELVRGFEALGFRRVGGLLADFREQDDLDAMVASYPPDVQPAFRLSSETPETVLAAPDGTAFVGVDWFWQQPSVRVRSLLADGSVVETQRAWDHLPPWPVAMARYAGHLRLRPEQDRSARGRRFTLIEGDDPAALWASHQQAVRGSPVGPQPHATIDQAAVLWAQLMHHDMRTEARAAWGMPVGLRWRLRYSPWLRPSFRGAF